MRVPMLLHFYVMQHLRLYLMSLMAYSHAYLHCAVSQQSVQVAELCAKLIGHRPRDQPAQLMSYVTNTQWWESQELHASAWWQQPDDASQVAVWKNHKPSSTLESGKINKIVKDRFKHCTTLGDHGKHPIPLEDRKALVLGLITRLSPGTALSRVAVAGWSAMTTHAALWLLCRAVPRTSVRTLRDKQDVYTTDYAIDILYESALELYATRPERDGITRFLRTHCWEGANADSILEQAVECNFDPAEVQDNTTSCPPRPRYDSRTGGLPSAMASASVLRPQDAPHFWRCCDTEKELERLQRKLELYTMKKQFSEEEARDAAREATQNRMVIGSVECSAMCQFSAGALPAAPAMNQQLLAMLALHQKPSNTHHVYSCADLELEELRSRLSPLHTRVRQQEEQQEK